MPKFGHLAFYTFELSRSCTHGQSLDGSQFCGGLCPKLDTDFVLEPHTKI